MFYINMTDRLSLSLHHLICLLALSHRTQQVISVLDPSQLIIVLRFMYIFVLTSRSELIKKT